MADSQIILGFHGLDYLPPCMPCGWFAFAFDLKLAAACTKLTKRGIEGSLNDIKGPSVPPKWYEEKDNILLPCESLCLNIRRKLGREKISLKDPHNTQTIFLKPW